MTVHDYLYRLHTRYRAGISTEHSYRADLQGLLESVVPKDVLVTNEPTRIRCGAPDYILTKNDIPIGYIEAKDLGADLSSKTHQEQFDRYRYSLSNLVITNYLDFWFYKNGELVTKLCIGEATANSVKANGHDTGLFLSAIRDFSSFDGVTITSSRKLAEMMAAKAKLLALVIQAALTSDEEEALNSSLKDQLQGFRSVLIHDITPKGFADIYAQTVAYGMFAARLHDPTLTSFTRVEAAHLIPKTNPFLRKMFQYIAGYDLDKRIAWIVDALADVFRATDVGALLKNFGQTTEQNDPVIHFYETFLSEYDPALRKARGVWYTPQPVVNFIVRSVDQILKTEFGLKSGLADSSKTRISVQVPKKSDARSRSTSTKAELEVHRVQILDPAAGTGTFLAEIIKHLYKGFKGQEGIWSSYVENDLIPRLNGFELLMASYAMAHLKLDLLLNDTGFKGSMDRRLKVYLTNSLEEYHPDTGTLFASWLSDEANQANSIKRDAPIMVVIGNPPYSGESSNKGDWIMNLMEDYKKEHDGSRLKEHNIKFVNDDYVKFIRFAQHFIEKTEEGAIAFITNHNYLNNITFRGMRFNLLKNFTKLYLIDLHGNSQRGEVSPDGSIDENVFDIRTGVAILFAIKKRGGTGLAEVYHKHIYGRRATKYEQLTKTSLEEIHFTKLEPKAPNFFLHDADHSNQVEYERGFKVTDLFQVFSLGTLTKNDAVAIAFTHKEMESVLSDFRMLTPEELKIRYKLKADSRDWQVQKAQEDVKKHYSHKSIHPIAYRPFDTRYTFYSGVSKGMQSYPQNKVTSHFRGQRNVGLVVTRQLANLPYYHAFVTSQPTEQCFISNKTREGGTLFPLYLFPTEGESIFSQVPSLPNLNEVIASKICEGVGLTYVHTSDQNLHTDLHEKGKPATDVYPQDIFDYIYCVLYSRAYREEFKEFLKIDFPRIPYPKERVTFWNMVKLGTELRNAHLFDSFTPAKLITSYPIPGDNVVKKPKFEMTDVDFRIGRIWINDTQYFDDVLDDAWTFHIGGYQPLQKWLKDRSGRQLTFEDILHYQRMVLALVDTTEIMMKIDSIGLFHD